MGCSLDLIAAKIRTAGMLTRTEPPTKPALYRKRRQHVQALLSVPIKSQDPFYYQRGVLPS